MRRALLALGLLIAFCGIALAQVGLPWPGPGTVHSVGGGSSIAIVSGHKASAAPGSGGVSSIGATITGTSAGNFITVGLFWCNSGCAATTSTVSSVTSSAGETCSQATGAANLAPAGNYMTDVWYCKNTVGGNDTITANFSAPVDFPSIGLQEWSGASTTAPDDGKGNKGATASGTSLSVATNGNTSISSELIYSILASGQSITPGQTQINTIFGTTLMDEYQIAGGAGSYSNSATVSPSSNISMSLAAFK